MMMTRRVGIDTAMHTRVESGAVYACLHSKVRNHVPCPKSWEVIHYLRDTAGCTCLLHITKRQKNSVKMCPSYLHAI
jgi:hypothetical protein